MSALSEAQALLPAMSRAEKAQLLQWIARDIGEVYAGVEARPDVCGGAACIVRTRIPVWVLERARQLGLSEGTLLQSYPSLRAEDLTNAWAYVRSHREEIERDIRENEEA